MRLNGEMDRVGGSGSCHKAATTPGAAGGETDLMLWAARGTLLILTGDGCLTTTHEPTGAAAEEVLWL